MIIPINSKFIIVNSSSKVNSFYESEEKANRQCNQLNEIHNNRPKNEYGYMMGDHDFIVDSIQNLKQYSVDLPINYAGALIDDLFYKNIHEAIEAGLRKNKKIDILVKYSE